MTLEQAMTGGVMQGSGRSELCGGESAVYWQLPFSGTRAVGFGVHDLTRPLCHEFQVYITASIQLRAAVTVWALLDGLVICKRASVACCAGLWPLLRFPETRIGAWDVRIGCLGCTQKGEGHERACNHFMSR